MPQLTRSRTSSGIGLGTGLAIVLALLVVRVTAPEGVATALGDTLGDLITLAISVIIESLPFVFLGIVLSIAVQMWLPPDFLVRRLPKSPLFRRAVLSLTGILLPVCECGNVPLARGFISRGLTVADAMTFLLAAPILNPVTIITTYQAFGWNDGILISRILGGFLIANLVGWLFSKAPNPTQLLTRGFARACAIEAANPSTGNRLRRSVVLFAHETSAMLPALFVGSAIAGLIQVGVPRSLLIELGGNPIWSVFVLMLLAFIISICSNVDAFFVLSLGSAFSPGAVVAFLVFGPMIDIKMLAMLRTTFTTKTLAQVTLVVALATMVIGLAVNLLV